MLLKSIEHIWLHRMVMCEGLWDVPWGGQQASEALWSRLADIEQVTLCAQQSVHCWEVSDKPNRDYLFPLNVHTFQNLNYDRYCEGFESSGLCIFSLQEIQVQSQILIPWMLNDHRNGGLMGRSWSLASWCPFCVFMQI